MHIVVNPVLTVAFELSGNTGLIPLMHVVLYKNKAKWKEHLVNYAFGSKNDEGHIDFENPIGETKALLFSSLKPIPTGRAEIHYYREGANISEKIIRDLNATVDKRPLLFVWDRNVADETAFYKALGVQPENMINLGASMTQLRELGLSLNAPFRELTLDELRM